jgi:hypothetical protein
MQALPAQNLDPKLQRLETDMFARLGVIFRRCPHLVGFTLQDSAELPEDANPSDSDEGGLFVSDIQFSRRVTEDEDDEVCHFINKTVAEMVIERSEASELLRDRTFARALH